MEDQRKQDELFRRGPSQQQTAPPCPPPFHQNLRKIRFGSGRLPQNPIRWWIIFDIFFSILYNAVITIYTFWFIFLNEMKNDIWCKCSLGGLKNILFWIRKPVYIFPCLWHKHEKMGKCLDGPCELWTQKSLGTKKWRQILYFLTGFL